MLSTRMQALFKTRRREGPTKVRTGVLPAVWEMSLGVDEYAGRIVDIGGAAVMRNRGIN